MVFVIGAIANCLLFRKLNWKKENQFNNINYLEANSSYYDTIKLMVSEIKAKRPSLN